MKLNIGCGEVSIPGELGVDRYRTPGCKLQADCLEGLPFKTESCEQVRFEHVLEHFPARNAVRLLSELYRVLEKGGKLLMGMPDMEKVCQSYLEASSLQDKGRVLRIMYGSQVHPGEFHQSGWDRESTDSLLTSLGFSSIKITQDLEKDPFGASLLVEATK